MINRQSDSVPRSSGGQWTGPWDTVPTGESTVERTVGHSPYRRLWTVERTVGHRPYQGEWACPSLRHFGATRTRRPDAALAARYTRWVAGR